VRVTCRPPVHDLLADLIDAADARADYADARFVRSRAESISTRNGDVSRAGEREEEGFGVRVRVRGAWGFAASAGCDRPAAEDALARALEVAERQPAAATDPGLVSEPPARGEHRSPFEVDPFGVPRERKLELLLAADAALAGDARIAVREAHWEAFRDERWLASTDGARCLQVTTECGGGMSATAIADRDAQVRSYPGSHRGRLAQAGFEHFERLALAAEAPHVAEQAVALLSAPECPAARTTLLLDGEQVALQVHESVGHATELDRVLGSEASYAGTSFLSPADAGSFRFGSEAMNVTADATCPGGLGTFAWDDEGVAGQAVPLVRDGVLRGFLSSRESAAQVGEARSGGCMRASGFARQPIVRMTNVNLEPGAAGTLEDLVAATDRGLLLETNRSWSIDDRRLHFQFATELAWEIRDGRRVRLLRNPVYAGVTPSFWAGLDAVCSAPAWRLHSLLNCGKGEPGQFVHVSHGAAPARFRDVEVGSG
jgi:TldD protein